MAAATYEARALGAIRHGVGHDAAPMPRPRLREAPIEVYKAVSLQIREIFALYTDLIEPLSLDEAYLDVTRNHPGVASATHIAEEIRTRIKVETGLTASAGASYNKFLANIASDQNGSNRLLKNPLA